MYKRILAPTDGSPIAELAVDAALDLGRACGSEIVAFSVAFPEVAPAGADDALVGAAGHHADALLEQAQERAGRVAARARAAGLACTALAAYSLTPAQAIVDAAQERQCDLIVMGSHGTRGLSGAIAGSVTQHVLAYSAIPVMVLRPARADAVVPAQF